MKTYLIENQKIQANTKKEAVEKYLDWHFEALMYVCYKSFNALYKSAVQLLPLNK